MSKSMVLPTNSGYFFLR